MRNPIRNERYAITLNIGLGGNPLASKGLEERAPHYAKAVSKAFAGAYAPIVANTLILLCVKHSATEDTDVLSFDVQPSFGDTTSKVKAALNELCKAYDQEAIAVTTHDLATGHTYGAVYGPKAAKWGDFDPLQFLPYDPHATNLAAAKAVTEIA